MKKGTKTQSGNKSQVIRDYAIANPDLGPTQIARDLQAQGVDAYPALVSQALRGVKDGKSVTKKRGRPPKSATNSSVKISGVTDYVAVLKSTADFVGQCGGVDQAVEALKVFQKVASVVKK